jgi:hypothetical protein
MLLSEPRTWRNSSKHRVVRLSQVFCRSNRDFAVPCGRRASLDQPTMLSPRNASSTVSATSRHALPHRVKQVGRPPQHLEPADTHRSMIRLECADIAVRFGYRTCSTAVHADEGAHAIHLQWWRFCAGHLSVCPLRARADMCIRLRDIQRLARC